LAKLTHEEIGGIISQQLSDGVTYMESELSPSRVAATKYYRGDKFGGEQTGRSQIVLTDVRDTVLAMLPSLVRLFMPTSGHVIEYQARPKALGDVTKAVEMASQATEFVNAVVLEQDNAGFLELHAAFKDALVRATGWIKWWWEDRSVYQTYDQQNLDVQQYETLVGSDDIEITKQSEFVPYPGGPTFYNVTFKHWRREGIAKISCTPPEEVIISRDARSLEDAAYIIHRTEKTKAQLLEMGVPEKEIDDFGGASSEMRQSLEEIARRGGIAHVDQAPTEAEVRHLWVEAYPYLSLTGKESELYRVTCIGPGCHVVGDPEPIDARPFALFCPDPEPHVLVGGSVAERVGDLQKIKSDILRAAADGLSQSLFPDTYYMEGSVDRQAMESTAMGKNIAVHDGLQPSQAVMEFSHEWKGQHALAMLNYLDTVKQQRIGPLPATLDPDALQSTPEIGVKATVQAASEQLELIARVFAATGMKQLGKGLLKLLVENQPRSRIARLRGQYVEVDPKAWDAEMDVSVHVALGTQEKLGVLAANVMKQEQALQLLGPTNPLVTVGQLVHSYRTMLELQGIHDVSRFWNDVPLDWQPPPAPETPDPNQLIAQAEMAKAQSQIAKEQAEIAQQRVKLLQQEADLHAQVETKQAELEIKREEMHLVDERERDKSEADIALRAAEINARYETQIQVTGMQVDVQREKIQSDQETAIHTAALTSQKPAGNGSEKPETPKKTKPKVKITEVEHDPTTKQIKRLRQTEE
jgi:hypothetical protein